VLDALNDMLEPHIFPLPPGATGDPRACPSCSIGRLSLKVGKYGAFIGCSNYPDCRFTRQLADTGDKAPAEPRLLGADPESGLEVSLRVGRFGPYLQLGENGEEKPKRASIPKGTDPEGLDLKQALSLLSLPREIGLHPEDNKPIVAGFGRFGPYIQHDGKYASLSGPEEVFTVGINRAVTLLAEKAARGGGRRRSNVIKDLGEHPQLGGKVEILNGKFGPYAKHGKVNATLPKDRDPAETTLEEAVELLAAKSGKGGAKKVAKKRAKKSAKPAANKAKTATNKAKTAAKSKKAVKAEPVEETVG
jgi:DNA topoisomerase-1